MPLNGTLFLLVTMAFLASLLMAIGVYSIVVYWRQRAAVVRRMKESEESSLGIPYKAIKSRFLGFVGSLGLLARPKDETELSHLRKNFLKAGIRKENMTMVFFGAKVFLGILFPALFSVFKLMIMKPLAPVYYVFVSVLLAAMGFYLPNLWLRMRIQRRKEMMLEGLPDALDLMVVCVEAGMGLDAAINRVAEEMKLRNRVVADEFRILTLELRAGKERRDALRSLAMRTDLEDVSSLVTLLIQTERFGTSVGQALRVHSDSMRVRRQQRAEEIASKLPVKLLLPLILFIFPSLFVTILGPAVIRIIRILLPTLGKG